MKSVNKILGLILLLLTMACTDSGEVKKKVYLLIKVADNPFFQEMENGVSENIPNKYELQIRAGKNESDVLYQIQVLDAIVVEARNNDNKIAGVIITPTSSGSELIPQLKQLKELGIPLIIVDTKIDEALTKSAGLSDIPFIGSSNRKGAKQAATYITNQIDKGGEILILKGVEGQETAQERLDGFIEVVDSLNMIDKRYNITVRNANWRRSDAIKIVSDFYSYGKKYDAIFASNDEMALGSYQALIDLNVEHMPIIVGFDATKEARLAVENRLINATIAQNPYKMGKDAVHMVDKIQSLENVNIDNLIPTVLIK